MLAALYTPIWTSAVAAPIDVVIVGVTFALLLTGRAPPIAIVAVTALAGQLVEAV